MRPGREGIAVEVKANLDLLKVHKTAYLRPQAFEDALHSQSYAVMVDSISTNSKEIYELWRRDMKLKTKNDAIAKVYEELSTNPTDTNIVKAMFANQILEGIYFYSGFAYLYTLARSDKMLGTAQMIRFIQRDEVTHLLLLNLLKHLPQ